MRMRCFIISGIALITGIVFSVLAEPTQAEIESTISVNESMKKLNDMKDEWRRTDPNSDMALLSYSPYYDPYNPDATQLRISYVSFGLAGILFLVGIIIGPPKNEEEDKTVEVIESKDQ